MSGSYRGPGGPTSQPRKQTMSLEAAMEEERIEVEALIAARNNRPPSALSNPRSSSPFTPRSPVRSMLDIGPTPARFSQQPVRSMLDMDSPPPSASSAKGVFSTPSSPVLKSNQLAHASNSSHPRHMSDVSSQPVGFGPRASGAHDPINQFKFGDIVTSTGQILPKRVFQGKKKDLQAQQTAMAHIQRGTEIPGLPAFPSDRGRHSIAGPSMRPGSKSRSPHQRLGARSGSPGNSLIQGRTLSPAGRALLQDKAYPELDMSNAYRKLSDMNRLRHGGLLGNTVVRKKSDDQAGGGRLVKDYFSPDGDELLDDSSDEEGYSTQEEGDRGRKADRDFDKNGKEPSNREVKSLLAAAEEERINVAKAAPQTKYRSLFDIDPEIKVTDPSGDVVSKSKKVHPTTNFDEGPASGTRTPMDSDDEADLVDIKRAQKLSFSQTAIVNTPNAARAVRIIYRGEYSSVVQTAKEEERALRKYIIATDLSDESTHALEWAVGTVLRDGDTMICLYCVDEEIGIAPRDGSAQVPDERKAMRDQGVALNTMTASKAPVTPGGSSVDVRQGGSSRGSPVPVRSKAEEERHMAVQDITERVKKYLRKTRLQVRVIVEVLHCKNPKHQILEIIDVVSPTLVILGSRGQSALKGVILGSFSNYLVTKSSVPVMVARKRLRKQSKYKKLPMTQVNNINNPTAKSLANAKID
ncbi:hypothetical protein N0V93_002211 [Gnomoniopsis smithogilvyi]|uniref:UspA domain-containing protein n=1 Tax=Gnomoniopsis smithogilvyi TaxID=1191159 RepID=A0A9W8YY85_9PEZI|nr:hypothetical protein N0V93_002211 [Gnomoniopsis smithogilvyi]